MATEELDHDVMLALGKQHYILKKLLLKLTFTQELELFMDDPEVRHDVNVAPVLHRAYLQGTMSPIFPHEEEEDLAVLERMVDNLPLLQTLLKRATKRDLAGEIRNSICNSWCSVLATQVEIDLAAKAAEEDLYERKQPKDRQEDFYMFQAAEVEDDDDEEKSSSEELAYDPMGLDPALASRRLRRRALAVEMSRFMNALSKHGVDDFIESLCQAESYEELRGDYAAVFTELFNLLTLSLLDSYSSPANRSKAMGVLSQVPQWLLSVVFKLSNPFKLMVWGCKMAVSIKTVNGSLLQSMLRVLVDIESTEKRLKKAKKKLKSADVKALIRHVDLLLLEGVRTVDEVELEHVVSAAALEQRKVCFKVMRMEVRRREKQDLVDWAVTPEARFLMLEFMPLLGRPILENYKAGGVGDHMKAAISCLTALIEAIELPLDGDLQSRKDAIDLALSNFTYMVFEFFRDTARTNPSVIEAILKWMARASEGGPEVLDLDVLLEGNDDAARQQIWLEVDEAIEHLSAGGHHAALSIPAVRALVPRFQKLIKAHVSGTEPPVVHMASPVPDVSAPVLHAPGSVRKEPRPKPIDSRRHSTSDVNELNEIRTSNKGKGLWARMFRKTDNSSE